MRKLRGGVFVAGVVAAILLVPGVAYAHHVFLDFEATGENVPGGGGDPDGAVVGTVDFNMEESMDICIDAVATDLDEVISVQILLAEDDSVAVDFGASLDTCVESDEETLDGLHDGADNYYVLVATEQFDGGAVAGSARRAGTDDHHDGGDHHHDCGADDLGRSRCGHDRPAFHGLNQPCRRDRGGHRSPRSLRASARLTHDHSPTHRSCTCCDRADRHGRRARVRTWSRRDHSVPGRQPNGSAHGVVQDPPDLRERHRAGDPGRHRHGQRVGPRGQRRSGRDGVPGQQRRLRRNRGVPRRRHVVDVLQLDHPCGIALPGAVRHRPRSPADGTTAGPSTHGGAKCASAVHGPAQLHVVVGHRRNRTSADGSDGSHATGAQATIAVTQAASAATPDSGSSTPWPAIIGGIVLAAAAAGGALYLMARRANASNSP